MLSPPAQLIAALQRAYAGPALHDVPSRMASAS